LAKKPKLKWQIEVRNKLEEMGIGYKELAERTELSEGTIRKCMCTNNYPGIQDKICHYLGIENDT